MLSDSQQKIHSPEVVLSLFHPGIHPEGLHLLVKEPVVHEIKGLLKVRMSDFYYLAPVNPIHYFVQEAYQVSQS